MQREATQAESEYFDKLEEERQLDSRIALERFNFCGCYELSKGDYERSIMTQFEYDSGYMS